MAVTPNQPVQDNNGSDISDLPAWVIKTPDLSAYGTALARWASRFPEFNIQNLKGKQSLMLKLNLIAIEQAKVLARAELASQIGYRVKGMLKKFEAKYGVDKKDSQADKIGYIVVKNIINQTFPLRHAETFWWKNGEVYVLVTLDTEGFEPIKNLLKSSVKSMNTSLGNSKVAWQKFQAETGFKDLEKKCLARL